MQVAANETPDQMKYVRDFVASYNKLIETCFLDCIHEFTTRDVKAKEETCALNCMEKYLKMNQRLTQRFQEIQMLTNENILATQKSITDGISFYNFTFLVKTKMVMEIKKYKDEMYRVSKEIILRITQNITYGITF